MAKKIVIIGGGFSGLNLAKNIKNKQYHITLVDRNNYTFFPPLLYQVATGFLEPSNIAYPYRKMLRNRPDISFKLGEFSRVIPQQKKVILTTGELEYDYLIFATGTETNYFGMENVQRSAIPMKTINDAVGMRNFLLNQMERATTLIADHEQLRRKMTTVIAGGGPTGVEVSGMLAEMRTSVLRKDYPELTSVASEIYLVDGLPQLLSPMSKKSQSNTYHALTKLGVKIILNTTVTDYVDGKVFLSNGQSIDTENLIWSAGVTSQVFDGIPKECYGRGRRLITDAYNKVEGLQHIYAIGDTCIQTTESSFPNGHPQVAQVALQQGKNLAKNFNRIATIKPLIPFRYNDKGSMAIIGRNKAVADVPLKLHFKGFVAWFIWGFIHLFSLVHYRNKITTFYNWIISYFTKDQALGMIIRPTDNGSRKTKEHEPF
ncbi:NAD(P)/FAD-dependent oxidoreductase [Sphingobacterium sp.]|uniref:NAD(P)/FAD-dependent oxidoreductase n=1 Tax=Sphingobacterium sp. TaxID=341027 RepID=UPI0031D7E9CC